METLRELLGQLTEISVLAIDLIALVVVVFGTVEAFVRACRLTIFSGAADPAFQPIWLRYARWLVAGLTFQLAADIIETSMAPGWEEIAKLAAIAVIRTFLNYFLGRDLAEVREVAAEQVGDGEQRPTAA